MTLALLLLGCVLVPCAYYAGRIVERRRGDGWWRDRWFGAYTRSTDAEWHRNRADHWRNECDRRAERIRQLEEREEHR